MDSLELAQVCAEVAIDKKCEDILILDLQQRTVIADYFVIASARNKRQLRAVAEGIAKDGAVVGRKTRRVEGTGSDRWVLLDLGDVVVHLFDGEGRTYYDLESLWADTPRIPVRKRPARVAS